MSIVDRIKRECQIKNITISALEHQNGLGTGTISKWDSSNPSAKNLYKVSKSLNISMEYLITGEDKACDLSKDEQEWLLLLRNLSAYDPELKKECIAYIKGSIKGYQISQKSKNSML